MAVWVGRVRVVRSIPVTQVKNPVQIVDDEGVIRDTLHLVMEQEGYEVVNAASGRKALG